MTLYKVTQVVLKEEEWEVEAEDEHQAYYYCEEEGKLIDSVVIEPRDYWVEEVK